MLTIELRIDGETKKITQDFISGFLFRKALELGDKRDKYLQKALAQEGQFPVDEQGAILNELYQFISEVFDKQFSAEEYERGTDARKVVDQSWEIVHGIISQTLDPMGEIEDEDGDKKKKKSSRKRS